MVEHDGFWTVLSGKISSDKIINNDMWVMNTFWTRNARNLPWEKLTKASVPPHALCYSPFCCLGRFYPFRGHGENHQQSQNQDLYSLGCSTVCYKRVKTCFLLVLFCTEWRDAFFFFVTMTKYPIADFWSSCFKTFRSIWFAVCTTLLPAHFVRWLFFFLLITTGLNQRGALKAPPFSYIRNGEEKAVDKSVSLLKHRCSRLLSYFEIQQET